MRWWGVAVSALVLSCSNDTFVQGDAAADGTAADAGGSDGIASGDAIVGSDSSVVEAGSCPNLGAASGCGGSSWCPPTAVCCASDDTGTQCTSGACVGTMLGCRNTGDCLSTNGDGGVLLACCLTGATVGMDSCPRVVKGGQSACGLASACTGTKLCSLGSECPGSKSCQKATVGGVTFGMCL